MREWGDRVTQQKLNKGGCQGAFNANVRRLSLELGVSAPHIFILDIESSVLMFFPDALGVFNRR